LLDSKRIEAIGMAIEALREEPVSEDLEEEVDKYIRDNFTIDKEQLDRFCLEEKDYMYSMNKSDMLAIAQHFANWQKQQMEKYRIAHCKSISNEQAELESGFVTSHIEKNNRMPTFLDAIEYGMDLQKKLMIIKEG